MSKKLDMSHRQDSCVLLRAMDLDKIPELSEREESQESRDLPASAMFPPADMAARGINFPEVKRSFRCERTRVSDTDSSERLDGSASEDERDGIPGSSAGVHGSYSLTDTPDTPDSGYSKSLGSEPSLQVYNEMAVDCPPSPLPVAGSRREVVTSHSESESEPSREKTKRSKKKLKMKFGSPSKGFYNVSGRDDGKGGGALSDDARGTPTAYANKRRQLPMPKENAGVTDDVVSAKTSSSPISFSE